MDISIIIFGVVVFGLLLKAIKIVPQQQIWVLERLGRFEKALEPGLSIIIPFIDVVSYKHTLKEQAVDITAQTAITKDNVSLKIDGVLYIKVIDAVKASYGVTNPYYAVTQLAQTTMRSEIGKMTMDKTFEEREAMNVNIVHSINEASQSWGIQCMRYEIKDIDPPKTVLQAMELQVAAERKKRAEILDSEGHKQAKINISEAHKQEVVLQSEAALIDQSNRSKGEAEAILNVAKATAESVNMIAEALKKEGGQVAASLRVAEQYVEAFKCLAKEGNSIIIPASANDVSSMVAQAMGVFNQLNLKKKD